jgi:hypothetical protein
MSSTSTRRVVAVGLLVALVLVIALVAASGPLGGGPRLPAPVDPKLPDLVMAPIEEVNGGLAEFTQAPVVRVEATIVNRGSGDFLLEARREFPWSSRWTVYQRTMEADGSQSEPRSTTRTTITSSHAYRFRRRRDGANPQQSSTGPGGWFAMVEDPDANRLADVDAWWAWLWSFEFFEYLERMDGETRERFRASAAADFAALPGAPEIRMQMDAWLTTARKP